MRLVLFSSMKLMLLGEAVSAGLAVGMMSENKR
jgi:hypothetical protein